MSSGSASLPRPPVPLGSDFYVTGGTLRPDAPSYIERDADKNLCEGLLRGEFCYVLTSRQMGKSSLMVRAVMELRREGVAVAVLDLTAIGQNLTVDQWYEGLLSRLGQQLNLEDELLAFCAAHPEWGPLQRWISALEQVVLQRIPGRVVVFVDEIDIVRSLPFSTDEFFAGIRECYNRRSREPAFDRLAFGLLGVAAPNELIRDTRMTPFNIGRRIELNDFSFREAAPLARGLGGDEPGARALLGRVLHWTGGHPFLTQRLCRALAETIFHPERPEAPPLPPVLPTEQTVDRLADKLFLSRQARDRDDNLIFVRERLLRSEVDVPGLLYLYAKVHSGQLVADDETNPLITVLRLAGITRGINGFLQVRNRIYYRVFDPKWVQTNMPEAEIRRQRQAGRRGLFAGLAIALVLLLSYLVFGPMTKAYRHARLAGTTVLEVSETYAKIPGYQDTFEATLDLGLGTAIVPVTESGSLRFGPPEKVDLSIKSRLRSPEVELRLLADGKRACLYAPALGRFQELEPPLESAPFDLPPGVAAEVGPMRALPLYRLLVDPAAAARFLKDAKNVEYRGDEELHGQPVRVIHWNHPAAPFLAALLPTTPGSNLPPIDTTAWVNRTNHLVLQLRMDLSPWAEELAGRPGQGPVNSLVITETHRAIELRHQARPAGSPWFDPLRGAERVPRLGLPPPDYASLASARRQFTLLLPPRLAQAPPELVDLSDYYNAAFVQSWHPGMSSNSLDVLPSGLLQLGGVLFDVRGIVQVSGGELERMHGRFPRDISGIKVQQSCRQLHFLHAVGWRADEGARVGSYVVHYAGGQEQTIPIVYGEDLRDWNARSDPATKLARATIVWTAINKAEAPVRLFKRTWVNPWPDLEILSIDYHSAMTRAAPFLIALTAEH